MHAVSFEIVREVTEEELLEEWVGMVNGVLSQRQKALNLLQLQQLVGQRQLQLFVVSSVPRKGKAMAAVGAVA